MGEPKKWYRTWGSFSEIKPVDVERSTDNSVWIKGRRSQRTGSWLEYWPTWNEAHAHLVTAAKNKVAQAEQELHSAHCKLLAILDMKEP
jgi:hypothetical protein